MADMILGCTGTRHGATEAQCTKFDLFLKESMPTEVHHGDCVGADAQMNALARARGIHSVSHPPRASVARAFTSSDTVLPVRGYIERNHDIVAACTHLIALPETEEEKKRSGTWSTIRYAKGCGVPVTIAFPSGRVVYWKKTKTKTPLQTFLEYKRCA